MPHINTQPGQHDQSVSAYIFRYIDDVPYLLLHRHKKYHTLMQPGGHIELHENQWQALLREIPEETGYDPAQLSVLQPAKPDFFLATNTVAVPIPFVINTHRMYEPTIQDHFHDDSVYVLVAAELPSKEPYADESQELRWLSQDQVIGWDPLDMTTGVKEIADAAFTSCLPTWVNIPVTSYA